MTSSELVNLYNRMLWIEKDQLELSLERDQTGRSSRTILLESGLGIRVGPDCVDATWDRRLDFASMDWWLSDKAVNALCSGHAADAARSLDLLTSLAVSGSVDLATQQPALFPALAYLLDTSVFGDTTMTASVRATDLWNDNLSKYQTQLDAQARLKNTTLKRASAAALEARLRDPVRVANALVAGASAVVADDGTVMAEGLASALERTNAAARAGLCHACDQPVPIGTWHPGPDGNSTLCEPCGLAWRRRCIVHGLSKHIVDGTSSATGKMEREGELKPKEKTAITEDDASVATASTGNASDTAAVAAADTKPQSVPDNNATDERVHSSGGFHVKPDDDADKQEGRPVKRQSVGVSKQGLPGGDGEGHRIRSGDSGPASRHPVDNMSDDTRDSDDESMGGSSTESVHKPIHDGESANETGDERRYQPCQHFVTAVHNRLTSLSSPDTELVLRVVRLLQVVSGESEAGGRRLALASAGCLPYIVAFASVCVQPDDSNGRLRQVAESARAAVANCSGHWWLTASAARFLVPRLFGELLTVDPARVVQAARALAGLASHRANERWLCLAPDPVLHRLVDLTGSATAPSALLGQVSGPRDSRELSHGWDSNGRLGPLIAQASLTALCRFAAFQATVAPPSAPAADFSGLEVDSSVSADAAAADPFAAVEAASGPDGNAIRRAILRCPMAVGRLVWLLASTQSVSTRCTVAQTLLCLCSTEPDHLKPFTRDLLRICYRPLVAQTPGTAASTSALEQIAMLLSKCV